MAIDGQNPQEAIDFFKEYMRRRNDTHYDNRWDEFDRLVSKFLEQEQQRKPTGEPLQSRWSLRRDVMLAHEASEYIENEWNNKTIGDAIRGVIQIALQEFAFRRGLHQEGFLFVVDGLQLRAKLSTVI